MEPVLVSARGAWLALGLALLAVLAMQFWAGLSLRGLYADGAFYAERLLLRHDFVLLEPARLTSQFLAQAPVVLVMTLGFDSPHAVALAFSLATNLLPGVLTLACLAVLPARERAFGLFPIFIFLAGSMSTAFASVADGATAAAYAWFLLLLILFGPLTRLRLAAILLLAAGALRLHEEMACLGPILALACLQRCRQTEERAARGILVLSALLVMAGCVVAIHDVLHPRVMSNRASLLADLASLRWLAPGHGEVDMMALAGLLAIPALALVLLRPGLRIPACALFLALAVLSAVMPAVPAAAFAARDNPCLLSAPAMAILLLVKNMRWPAAPQPAAALVIAALGLAIAAGDAKATEAWLGYTQAMRTALRSSTGIEPWQDALGKLDRAQARAMTANSWPWNAPLMSLWLTPGPRVTTIIANPPGIRWQPFDPEIMRAALLAGNTPATRSGFLALLPRQRIEATAAFTDKPAAADKAGAAADGTAVVEVADRAAVAADGTPAAGDDGNSRAEARSRPRDSPASPLRQGS